MVNYLNCKAENDAEVFFSIITVTYNCADTLERTIRSVITQSCDDYEYIIIDGASTDGTINIIKKYDMHISYWVSEKDTGIYNAMNKAIDISRGKWVAFINGNDWYEDGAFQKMKKTICSNDAEIYYGKVNYIVEGEKRGFIGISDMTDPEQLHFGNMYCHQGLFISRELFSTIGKYDESYRILADYKWLLDAHENGLNPFFVNNCIANFSAGGLSGSKNGIKEMYHLMMRYYRNDNFLPEYLEKRKGIAEFNILLEKRGLKLQEFIDKKYQYYIYGTGEYSVKCLKALLHDGFNVVAFIITGIPENDFWEERRVYASCEFLEKFKAELECNARIIIGTEKYEEEIISVLKDYDVEKEQYITMSQMFRWAYDIYTE